MTMLHLTIPLTIEQLAELIQAQFSAEEQQQLQKLLAPKSAKAKEPKPARPSVADDLREAFLEVKQYQRGEIQLPTMQEFLDELDEL